MGALSDELIIVLSDACWDDPKRVRHKMPMAWAAAGNHVLWVEEAVSTRPTRRRDRITDFVRAPLRHVAPRLAVGTPPPIIARDVEPRTASKRARDLAVAACIHRWLRTFPMRPARLVIWQEAALYPLLELVPHDSAIYYASDRYRFNSPDESSDRVLADCCKAVDVVFATSEKIHELTSPHQPNSHVVPHAVDLEWFRRNEQRTPTALEGIDVPRVVFTGVATTKVDFGLVEAVARAMPHVHFVIAGPVLDTAKQADFVRAAAADNVHFLGAQPIDDLPAIMKAADILMLPYVKDLTRTYSGLPLKMYEYLAASRPIVSTDFTSLELAEPNLVDIEHDAEGWVRAIRSHLDRPLTNAERAKRRRIAEANTYEHRIEQQRSILRATGRSKFPRER